MREAAGAAALVNAGEGGGSTGEDRGPAPARAPALSGAQRPGIDPAGQVVQLAPSRDARLLPYALVTLAGLVGALLTGEPALAALAVPFGVALVLGLRRRRAIPVRLQVILDREEVLEGGRVRGEIRITWEEAFSAEVMLHRLEGVEVEGERAWALPRRGRSPARKADTAPRPSPTPPGSGAPTAPPGPRAPDTPPGPREVDTPPGTRTETLDFTLRADHWGLHGVGEVWVRLHAPLGLFSWQGKLTTPRILRVLPRSERLDRLLDLTDSRSAWGAHLSRRIGHGNEFAELRPYVPGDRLRDLNWTATARRGRPFVNRHHPELSGEVVIVFDAFADGSRVSAEALAQAARVAWAMAGVHLEANDRVGLAGIGRSTQWLPPGGGQRARYRLLQTLLRIGSDAAAGRSVAPDLQRIRIPPAALVVALSSLESEESLRALRRWRSRGRSVVVARIDAFHRLESATPSEALAIRLWRLELELRRRSLAQAGIPVVSLLAGEPVARLVPALSRVRRAPILHGRPR